MKTFRIIWSTPSGALGWITIEECIDLEDAVDHWMNHKTSIGIPWDATIDEIKPVLA
jgi:hypothetical protein